MKDTALHPVAADYRVEVARVLADLPPGEAEEILDDVELNLSEVVAELDDTVTSDLLRSRLGTPQEYAAELRAAAGYPPLRAGGSLGGTWFGAPELVLVGLVLAAGAALVTGIVIGRGDTWWLMPCVIALVVEAANALWLRGREPGVPEVAALAITRRARALGESLRTGRFAEPVRFVVGLRSAWWVARAAVVGLVPGVLSGSVWAGVVAGVLALVASLWFGSRSTRDRRLLWAAVPLNVLVVGLGIGLVSSGELTSKDHYIYDGSYGPVNNSYSWSGPGDGNVLLGTMNGRPVQNIYPFDAQGRPLKDVLLFDQDGKQLGLAPGHGDDVCLVPYGPPQVRVENRERLPFPQPRVVRNPNGEGCRIETGVPFTIAIPVQPGQDAANPQSQAPGQPKAPTPQSSAPAQQNPPAPQTGQPTSPTAPPVPPLSAAPPAAEANPSGPAQPNGQAPGAPPASAPASGAPSGS